MAIIASSKGSGTDFEPVPEGTHFAICTRVVYLGIQESTFDGQRKEQPKVYFGFEVPEVRVSWEKDGEKHEGPAIIGRIFTLNIGSKSNLGPFIESWRGTSFTPEEAESFDVERMLGKVCNLVVVHDEGSNGKIYANISAAMKITKRDQEAITNGTLKADPEGELIKYNADEPSNVFDKLPKFLQKKIEERITTTKSGKPIQQKPAATKPGKDDFDDDIPF